MNALFQEKKIQKTYWAIVKQKPPKESDRLVNFLTRNASQNKSYCNERTRPGSKEAALSYKVIGKSENYYLLEVDLETGRHHQIRAQLAHIGCPIKGDLKYGFPRSNVNGGISLHAREIRFVHPVTKKEVEIIAEMPEGDIWAVFDLTPNEAV